MVDIQAVNQKISESIIGTLTKSSFLTGLGWVIFGVIVLSIVGWGFWRYLDKKKFNKKIQAFGIIHGYFSSVPIHKDIAKTVKIGKGGFEVLYLKKLKTWKLAHSARSGINTYTFYVLPDGYWYPGQLKADLHTIDKEGGLIPVVTTNPTMRSQYTSLEKQIESLHGEKTKFWDKYGVWVMSTIYLFIMGIFVWLSFREVADFLGAGSALAGEMTKLAEVMNRLAINLNGAQPGGLVPAT